MNVKKLFKKPEKFTDYDPDSPAVRAAQKWDAREGEIIVQNYNLRRILIGLMLGIVCLAGALAYKSVSSSVVPYIVEVDTTNGTVRNIGTIQSSRNYRPTEAVYKYFLTQFVKDVRGVPLDPIVYKENLTEAYGFLTKDASAKLQTIFRTEKTMEKIGSQTVTVTISTVLPLEGGSSYQVRWTEDEYSVSSGERTATPYSGVFTVQVIHSDDAEQLDVNPVGIYIADFSWSKDTTAAATTSQRPAQTNQANQSKRTGRAGQTAQAGQAAQPTQDATE